MKLNFKISEFNISGEDIPEDIADKILKWHILPAQRVRNILDIPMWASQKSGYRSLKWEKSKGRSGNSQHVFKDKGAVDWTCYRFSENKDKFLKYLIEETDYTRLAVYNSFIHCDYKNTSTGRRELYTSTPDSVWTLDKFII